MLLIHAALHAEAKALIRHFNLKRCHVESAFACFAADEIYLVESGIGKLQSAAAVGWLSGKMSAENPIWLNVGMAGHADRDIGDLVRAQRIEDGATGKCWYPVDIFDQSPDGENLRCLDEATAGYPLDAAVDMESAGFISAASRFTTLELIQSLKIISDNSEHPPRRFKSEEVTNWFDAHLMEITHFIKELTSLRCTLADPAIEVRDLLLERFHFSQYQQGVLHRLIQRYQALYSGHVLTDEIPTGLSEARAVLNWIETKLAQSDIRY